MSDILNELLNERGLIERQNLYFQQDEAPAHYLREITE